MPLDSPALRSPLRLPPGEYRARVTYINSPDYGYVHYDPYRTPAGIWEGAITSEPVRFAVAPAKKHGERLGSRSADNLALELLALSGRDGVTTLIERIPQPGVSRSSVLTALRRAEALPLRELTQAVDRLPPDERTSLLVSMEFRVLMERKGDCELLTFLVGELEGVSFGIDQLQSLFAAHASRCPAIAESLRAAVLDPGRSLTARANAAMLLGVFRDRADIPLFIDVLERRLPGVAQRAAEQVDALRASGASSLGLLGGPDAVAALARALADERRNFRISGVIARALYEIGGAEAIPPLVGALSSANPNLVIQAIGWLREMKASTAVPDMIKLLRHRNPTIRSYAANALRMLGDASAEHAMTEALDDADENVRANALFYLAEHGDGSIRDRFIAGLESRRQNIREAAIAGIRRFGTGKDFPDIRRLYDLPGRPDIHGYLPLALGSLTFASDRGRRGPKEWDEWYAEHRTSTRVEWAREALAKVDEEPRNWPFTSSPQRGALIHLAERRDARFLPDFERAALSTRFAVRIEAARAIATFDKPKAARFLVREFAGRFHGACDAANRALNELTGERRTVDCRDPQARSRAAADWKTVVADSLIGRRR
ncbi:MAG TPA: HEAT repeat domain-containing protein [Vicinamibacterales bacterium]|nr:HEAT repeat domain-containing protein [Vicinamibacterales bacterium]